MRLWSLHPSFLDSQGLVACWREGLLARKVLRGETRGYKNHPQLQRFKTQSDPVGAIDAYLAGILDEANQRGYRFDHGKIDAPGGPVLIPVTDGQLRFELDHLRRKLAVRDARKYAEIAQVSLPMPHPIFKVIAGEIEDWEKV